MKKALIVQGGWPGHQPAEVAAILATQLRKNNFEVEISDTLDSFREGEKLKALDLIVPIWTMGTIEQEQLNPLLEAVKSGVGIGGVHGGMADAFRNETEYQFMVGGQWVAHPGGDGVEYVVHIVDQTHPITAGIADFTVKSEKYYMHIDPAIKVLAVTYFDDVAMPVTWVTRYGKGRVFYCSLGHQANIVAMPPVLEMVTRGLLWASEREP